MSDMTRDLVHRPAERKGYTIVELVVVIAVIALLTLVVTVSFNGVINRAHDSAVRNDLATFGKVMQLHWVEERKYPNTFPDSGISGIHKYKMSSKASYAQNPKTYSNLTACFSIDGSTIGLIALSASGRAFSAYSVDNFEVREFPIASWVPASTTASERCQALGTELSLISPWTGGHLNLNGYRYYPDTGITEWRPWVEGK